MQTELEKLISCSLTQAYSLILVCPVVYLLLGVFVLCCSLAKIGVQRILFRAFQGIAVSFCLLTAVSIIGCFPKETTTQRWIRLIASL